MEGFGEGYIKRDSNRFRLITPYCPDGYPFKSRFELIMFLIVNFTYEKI